MASDILVVDAIDMKVKEFFLAKSAVESLEKYYPGHQWAADVQGGLLNIRNMNLSGRMGFTINHVNSYSASDIDKQLMKAGGEILERFRVSRGHIEHDAIASLPMNRAGHHYMDLD
jgi:hypothetical protein